MMDIPDSPVPTPYTLQCMDLWSGNQSVASDLVTSGLELSVYSQPYHGEQTGGDVHYVSLCAGGVVTRIVLADVSGHGEAVAETSQGLRSLVRRFMNHKSQMRLVREINRAFTALTQSNRFATAIIATYLANDRRLVLCNAGHPRPLWFRQRTGRWSFVTQDLVGTGHLSNLPLGFDESTAYQQFSLTLEPGDIFVLYTDALTEARSPEGRLLGEEGLLQMVSSIETSSVRELSQELLARLRDYAGHQPADDDVTILAMRYTASRWRLPTLGEKINAYAKLLRWKPV
ncbi:MAG: serine/threonine-protein phosphatase [Planctomycetes bacterium]|nr:serine/threonine-protein phosphatase [Planctomycetota bacterium]